MKRLFLRKVAASASILVLAFLTQVAAQQPAQVTKSEIKNSEIDRLLKSLDGNTWFIAETQYGLTYDTGYLGLRQITLNTPKNEIGNKWFWMIYPLSNIDHLWDNDIKLFQSDAETRPQSGGAETLGSSIPNYIRAEQKCVYLLLPKMSVVAGVAGARQPGKGFYDFGNYLRVTEIRVHKDKVEDFEKFAATRIVPIASEFLPKAVKPNPDRLPRYFRTVKIEVNMSKEPQFHEFLRKYLIPAAEKTKTTVFVYHTIYGSEANYLLLFPFENEQDIAATGERVLSALWQKSHDYFGALQIDTRIANMIINVQEMITKVRPDLSPRLENKYAKWWN